MFSSLCRLACVERPVLVISDPPHWLTGGDRDDEGVDIWRSLTSLLIIGEGRLSRQNVSQQDALLEVQNLS